MDRSLASHNPWDCKFGHDLVTKPTSLEMKYYGLKLLILYYLYYIKTPRYNKNRKWV